jgi:hypothetical protein
MVEIIVHAFSFDRKGLFALRVVGAYDMNTADGGDVDFSLL